MTKKIACLGGGSWYFARTLGDLVTARGLAGSEIALYDIDDEKCALMERHGRRLADLAGTGMRVRASATLADAVDGADFALAAIGGAGKSSGHIYDTRVHLRDILIPARYGVHQLIGDTGGPAGMMMALRSIPAYLEVCREMERRAPRVVFFNHSNPMAVLCRAMSKYTAVNVVGICHGVQIGIKNVARVLGVPGDELETTWVGTNHYHWFTAIRHRGRDVYPEVMRRFRAEPTPAAHRMTQRLSELHGHRIVYPDDAHALEFYPFLTQAPDEQHLPYGQRFGGHSELPADGVVREPPGGAAGQTRRREQLAGLERELGEIGLPDPEASWLDGEGLGVLIAAIASGRRHVHIVNVANRGSIPNLPDYAVVEIEAVTDSTGLRPIHTGPAPVALMGLLQKRIAWQELVADAGVKGDRNLALQAMLVDEMAVVPEQAEAMLDELLESSKELLPQFRPAGRG
jgi:alpha-galactosidase